MTINTFSYTPPFTPAEQNNSAYLSAATDPIKIIPDEVIKMVADSGGWHLLGVRLGLTQNQLNTIIINSGNYQHLAACHMLYEWLDKEGVAATPAALCSALEDIKLAGISRHIESVLLVNTQYFCSMPQSSADTRDAPAPMVNPGYYGDNSQLSFESRPAFIDINPPRLQECAAMGTDAAGHQPAPENITFYFSNPPHSSAGIRPAVINREDMNQPLEYQGLKGYDSTYSMQIRHELLLEQKDKEFEYKNKQLSEAHQRINLLNTELSSQRHVIDNLTRENEALKAELSAAQSNQTLIHSGKQQITVPVPGAEQVNSQNAAEKSGENRISNQPVPGHSNMLTFAVKQNKEVYKDLIEKAVLKSQVAELKKEVAELKNKNDWARSSDKAMRKFLYEANVQIRDLNNEIKTLSGAAPASASHSRPLPSAEIVPGKNKRRACGDGSMRTAKKSKPGTR